MVGATQVLLSFAVLSALGFDSVLGGGRLKRQDGTANTVQSAPGGVNPQSTATVASLVSASGDPTGSTLGGEETSPGPGPPSVGSGMLRTTIQVNLAPSSASTGKEYGDPSVFGTSGTLTTDTRAPTGSIESSSSSLELGSWTRGGPPPAETRPSLTRTPPAPPLSPVVDDLDAGDASSLGAAAPSAAATTTGLSWPPPLSSPTHSFSPSTSSPSTSSPSTSSPSTSSPSTSSPSTSSPSTSSPSTSSPSAPSPSPSTSPSTSTSSMLTAAAATTAAQARPTPPRGGPPGGGPPRVPSTMVTAGKTETVDLGYGATTSNDQTTFLTSTRVANETFTYGPSGSFSYCQASDLTAPPTSWSVVHTTTITWYGNPEDYTPPYPAISIPHTTSSCVVLTSPAMLTISVCASTGMDSKYKTCEVTTTQASFHFGPQLTTTPAIVFLTTDKNPAVVFSSFNTPNYGVSQEPKTRDNHVSPTSDGGAISTPIYNSNSGPQAITDPAKRPNPTTTPVTVAVQPTGVVINGNTIRDNPAQPTQVVIVADQTFTIDPTRVVGAGATIDRPSATGGVYVPVPTSTNLGGILVVVSSTVAIIGGSSFTLGPTPTTATVSGQTFTVGPGTIAAASQTLALPTLPSPTEVVVAGADLITAIGPSVLVIKGTTLTYSTSTTLQVDDDTITLGPGGVTVHGGSATIGGASQDDSTQYALVGGATLTKIGASVVVIRDVTYTVGPGAATTTTVVGGETVTIKPEGVTVGTLTLAYPFGPTTVITPGATGTGGARVTGTGAAADSSSSSGGGEGEGEGEEDAAFAGARPWIVGVIWGFTVAVGVGVMA